MKRVSIKDIASQAGVAPSTVSLVLNGKSKDRRISDALAARIKALVAETGYQPNQAAASLRTGKTKIIGLIVEDISNVFFATLAKTIEDKAYSFGYRIVYCSTENNDEKGNELIKMLLNHQVDGFLITPSKGMAKEISGLLKRRKPVVLMDRYFPDLEVPYVLADNHGGVSAGVELLIEKGYSNIAFVTVDLDQVQMRQREMGYRETLERYGANRSDELILRLPFEQPAKVSMTQITSFLKKNTSIDAVFFATNYIGVIGLESIKLLGLIIPEDIAVICFDDHDVFRVYSPGITIIEQPIEEIARTAIDLLIAKIEGKVLETKDSQTVKKASLVQRGST